MLASLEFVVLRWTDIAVAWLLTYLVHSTLILLATWVATSSKRMGDATHDLFWKTALVGGIVTASLQTAVAREPLAGQLRLAPRTAPSAVPAMRLAVRDGPPGNEPRVFFMRQRGTHWTPGVLILWLTTASAGLLWLTAGHARTLLGEADPEARARELIEGAMTVRQAEQRSVKKKPGGKPAKDPNISDLEASVSNRLGLKIQIIHKGDKGGEVRIAYKSLEQLDELTRRLSRSSVCRNPCSNSSSFPGFTS